MPPPLISIRFPASFRPLLWLVFALASLATAFCAEPEPSIESVQKAAEELAKVRAETTRLKSDWRWQRETIGATIDALENRLHNLQLERDMAEAKFSAERSEIEELTTKASEARALYESVDADLKGVADRLVAMRPWLPPRLALAVDLPLKTLAEPDLPATDRMQYIATVWARCLQFNRAITHAEETIVPPGETGPRVMDVIYWGMSHAYALDRGGNAAYFGHPGESGWSWESAAELSEQVARLIAVYEDQAEPAFVAVPVEVSDPIRGGQP